MWIIGVAYQFLPKRLLGFWQCTESVDQFGECCHFNNILKILIICLREKKWGERQREPNMRLDPRSSIVWAEVRRWASCLVPDLRRKTFSFLSLRIRFAVGVLRITFKTLLFLVYWVFHYERVLNCYLLFCIYEMVMWFLILIPVIECIMMIHFHVKPILHFLDHSV